MRNKGVLCRELCTIITFFYLKLTQQYFIFSKRPMQLFRIVSTNMFKSSIKLSETQLEKKFNIICILFISICFYDNVS